MNILYHGDCLEEMKNIPDGSVDLILTDPPYGIDYQTFRTKREKLVNDDNVEWVGEFSFQCGRVIKHERHLYCFVDPEFMAEFIFGFRENGFKIRNVLTIPRAVKGNGGDRIFQQQNEFCVFATKGKKNEGRKFNQTKILKPSDGYAKDKRYSAKEWLYRLPDNWYWTKASEHNSNNKMHPTQKYVPCLEDMLDLSSNPSEVVIDPFMGSGSTGVACVNLNRDFIGIEMDDKYFEIAKKRIEEAKGLF